MSVSQLAIIGAILTALCLILGIGAVKIASAHSGWRIAGMNHNQFFNLDQWDNPEHINAIKQHCSKHGYSKFEQLLSEVEEQFDFTQQQLGQWQHLLVTLNKEKHTFEGLCEKFFTKVNHESTPARLELLEALMVVGVETLQRIRPAFTEFYNVLQPSQQELLDEILAKSHQARHTRFFY